MCCITRRALPSRAVVAAVLLSTVLSACGTAGSGPPASLPRLEMSAATLVIREVEIADRFPPGCSSGPTCHKPQAGHQILIVWLEREDGGDIDEIRESLFAEILPLLAAEERAYAIARDGSKSRLAVASIADDERFALVFAPPESAHGFKLVWPAHPEIDLGK